MKRHHVIFVFLLIFGGYFAYIRFDSGYTDGVGAIRMGIAFPLFGAIGLFDGRLVPRLRVFVRAMMLLATWGLLTYTDFINGNIRNAIIFSIMLILVGIPRLFDDNPSRPWLRPLPYIGMVIVLIIILLLLFRG